MFSYGRRRLNLKLSSRIQSGRRQTFYLRSFWTKNPNLLNRTFFAVICQPLKKWFLNEMQKSIFLKFKNFFLQMSTNERSSWCWWVMRNHKRHSPRAVERHKSIQEELIHTGEQQQNTHNLFVHVRSCLWQFLSKSEKSATHVRRQTDKKASKP